MTKHLEFQEFENKDKKTRIFRVNSMYDGLYLGMIRWHTGWRQYIFEPFENTFYSWDCLKDLSDFIKNLMEERKKRLEKCTKKNSISK